MEKQADIVVFGKAPKEDILREYAAPRLIGLSESQKAIPELAKDEVAVRDIEVVLPTLPTYHQLRRGDARAMDFLPAESVHLVLTSPPYWTLKQYNESDGQLGRVDDYESFLAELDQVWSHCLRALVPGRI